MKRPDMLLDHGFWALVIEVDELQHDDIPCWDEETRLNVIAADLQVPVVVLRLKVDTPVACLSRKRRSNGEFVYSSVTEPFERLMGRAQEKLESVWGQWQDEVCCNEPVVEFVVDGAP